MRKKHLEIALSEMKDIAEPDARLEQYRTPPSLVSDILWEAMGGGDIGDKSILELGCGGAPFALGALMLGARSALGMDMDPRCLEVAGKNLALLVNEGYLGKNSTLELIEGDVSDPALEIPVTDTVFMNPPFGAQNRNADRGFIMRACRCGSVIYSIHNGSTRKFVLAEYERMGASNIEIMEASIELPHRFHFHRMERGTIDVLLLRVSMNS
ncbi:MAG: 50S ribosomal protein L11 methyltransferase [Candidatus Thermoplasmatota archaeon]|nr:50S ribosomal protein L11 methyltransferase [Candidatus Thermoplasmatota archaeon]